jgi:dihydrofolate synthase/folylpolyglutamate synthase
VRFLEEGLNYEKTRGWKYDKQWLDLSRMDELLAALGNPHRRYKVLHVAGTKGKGSTAGAAARCLQQLGWRTGLITSPHLISPCERTAVDGRDIDEQTFTDVAAAMQPFVEKKRHQEDLGLNRAPTYFEMLTAMGFKHFADRQVDWAVVEVGLGGRLDSTNVVSPTCCVITAIGLDHVRKLGTTPEAIAAEKGGILKKGVPVMLGRQRYPGALAVLRRMADERRCERWEVGRELEVYGQAPLSAPADAPDAPLGWQFGIKTPQRSYDSLCTPLLGAHQLDNLAAAVGSLELASRYTDLVLDPGRIAEAIAGFRIPGRVEVIQRQPAVILDVAHTVDSMEALLKALDAHFPGRPLRVVFGCSSDKDVPGMLQQFAGRCASFTVTEAKLSRAMAAEKVAQLARETGLADSCGGLRMISDAWTALQDTLAQANAQDVVCATGSFYTAGEMRAEWRASHPDFRG